jgi:type II secretory pathway component PulM
MQAREAQGYQAVSHLKVVPDPEEKTDSEHVTQVLSDVGLAMVKVSEAFALVQVAMNDAIVAVDEYLQKIREAYEVERAKRDDTDA